MRIILVTHWNVQNNIVQTEFHITGSCTARKNGAIDVYLVQDVHRLYCNNEDDDSF